MRLTHLLAFIAGAFLLGAILFPVFATAKMGGDRNRSRCFSKVRQQSVGLLQYASDADERFPIRDAWMDALAPYAKDENVLYEPASPKGSYHYAFNAALSSAKATRLKDPAKTPTTYDSVNPVRNASDLVASLPAHGRHPAKQPTSNTIGYADGHARAKWMAVP